MLLRGVGCHKLPDVVWGEAPAANGFFVIFGAMKRILGHKMRIIGDWWLDEPRAKILGMRARAYSRLAKSAPIGICRYGNYSLYSTAHTHWRRGHEAWLPPRYFPHEKVVQKHFVQVLE